MNGAIVVDHFWIIIDFEGRNKLKFAFGGSSMILEMTVNHSHFREALWRAVSHAQCLSILQCAWRIELIKYLFCSRVLHARDELRITATFILLPLSFIPERILEGTEM